MVPLPVAARATWTEPIAVSNDPDFDRFFVKHYDGLVASLTVITGDRQRADDCVQEAFIRAYARWRRVRRYDNPATWVRRVAINLSRDAKRSETRRRRREDRQAGEVMTATPSHEAGLIGDIEVVALLQALPRQQRTVAALFYVEDISLADIAESLDITTGAVKFHLSKARERLRAILEAEDVSNV